jgi:very-short-patch-repair endonuclease
VTTPTGRRVAGVVTRRARARDARDAVTWRGIPVTTVARTLVDLAAVLAAADLARACHEAGVRHGTTPAHVEAVLARRPTSPGAATLREILRGESASPSARSNGGSLRARATRDSRCRRPTGRSAARRVDCHWPDRRVTVELDGYRYHGSRHAWEQDRRREREARARGDEFRRYTSGDVFESPRLMLAELRSILRSGRHETTGQDGG